MNYGYGLIAMGQEVGLGLYKVSLNYSQICPLKKLFNIYILITLLGEMYGE